MIRYETFDGEILSLPSKRIICPQCDGAGAVDVFRNGVPSRYFEEDPDFGEDYRSGMYDTVCEECRGNNVVNVVDRDALDVATRERFDESEEEIWKYQSEVDAERAYFQRAAEGMAHW